ncbi:polysaccharide biosynthesis/export family protein [Novosphingobium sp. Rr 2-17]|uniref:polysaccharide biosynthesis/export family protein n=1 Tax=Novosphingobium sp. Rr 2-17 TaxID=555793 RepID=UPI001ED96E77|nr:polysaccharide biosynthesis/export family protein [Novosphingobium sp. Rr 2-17]
MLVDLNDQVARQVFQNRRQHTFAQIFGNKAAGEQLVGAGDVIDVGIWEAPPAALFGISSMDSRLTTTGTTSAPANARSASIPEQMVDSSGQIVVPFVGSVLAVGRTPRAIASEIASRLAGKAHDPQVIVRISTNQAANVTVVGEVSKSGLMPITTKGERLLDAIASAGGVKQQVNKVTIQVSRGGVVASQPLADVIGKPQENIVLQPNDVVTALYQAYSFQALGAFNTNAEVNFEATGLTLAQALGRIGGLQDNRANVKGVFIFRLEDPLSLGNLVTSTTRLTPDNKIPVIYRVDMSNPSAFFVAQGFHIQNGDILYVSNAPLIDIQKFVNVISSTAFSVVSIGNAAN